VKSWIIYLTKKCLNILHIIKIKSFLQRKYNIRVLAKSEYLLDSQSRSLQYRKDMQQDRWKKQEAHKQRRKQEKNFQHQGSSFPSYVNEYENSVWGNWKSFFFSPQEYREFKNRRNIQGYRLYCCRRIFELSFSKNILKILIYKPSKINFIFVKNGLKDTAWYSKY